MTSSLDRYRDRPQVYICHDPIREPSALVPVCIQTCHNKKEYVVAECSGRIIKASLMGQNLVGITSKDRRGRSVDGSANPIKAYDVYHQDPVTLEIILVAKAFNRYHQK